MPTPSEILFAAIVKNDRANVSALLKKNKELAVKAVATQPRFYPEITHWIYRGDTPLHFAAAGHRVEIGKMLLAAGADPNSSKNHRRSQPLHYAADGHLEDPSWDPKRQVAMIRLLLKAGADIHGRDKTGATPLHRAVRTRCAAATRCLLEAGANPAAQNKPGSTAFHLAVQNTGRGGSGQEKARLAQREILEAFLEMGVKPTLTDGRGKTVLE
ncbi:MAG TPA: ankyrin repeat domain-containing protein [Candidatus Saccharimonadales bacterium]|nr:ankyrin repeat domain-containing protein [Candidatus Saccharimonadales bacterium]